MEAKGTDLKKITTLNHKVLDDPVKLTLLVTKRLPSLSAFFTLHPPDKKKKKVSFLSSKVII